MRLEAAMEASYTSGGGRSVSILSKEYIRVQITHGIDEIGGIEPPRSIPSIGNFAAHDDVVGELAIFRGTSTSWVVVAGAAPVAVEIAVGELGFADNGEWGTEMVEPDRDGWLVSSQPGAQIPGKGRTSRWRSSSGGHDGARSKRPRLEEGGEGEEIRSQSQSRSECNFVRI
uniref:Uncharacterized protein n=1 Tax=Oryza barthii TaxID=65489 RepID=A0A0D3GR83_9ORYZ